MLTKGIEKPVVSLDVAPPGLPSISQGAAFLRQSDRTLVHTLERVDLESVVWVFGFELVCDVLCDVLNRRVVVEVLFHWNT